MSNNFSTIKSNSNNLIQINKNLRSIIKDILTIGKKDKITFQVNNDCITFNKIKPNLGINYSSKKDIRQKTWTDLCPFSVNTSKDLIFALLNYILLDKTTLFPDIIIDDKNIKLNDNQILHILANAITIKQQTSNGKESEDKTLKKYTPASDPEASDLLKNISNLLSKKIQNIRLSNSLRAKKVSMQDTINLTNNVQNVETKPKQPGTKKETSLDSMLKKTDALLQSLKNNPKMTLDYNKILEDYTFEILEALSSSPQSPKRLPVRIQDSWYEKKSKDTVDMSNILRKIKKTKNLSNLEPSSIVPFDYK
jgi:hypothetical protein